MLGILTYTVSALADEAPKCNDPMYNIFRVHPGFKCETAKGKVLKREAVLGGTAYGWKNADGITWILADYAYSFGGRADVVSACTNAGAELPSIDDLKEIENTGLNELLPPYSDVSDPFFLIHTSDPKVTAHEENDGNFHPRFSYESDDFGAWPDRMYPLCVKRGAK